MSWGIHEYTCWSHTQVSFVPNFCLIKFSLHQFFMGYMYSLLYENLTQWTFDERNIFTKKYDSVNFDTRNIYHKNYYVCGMLIFCGVSSEDQFREAMREVHCKKWSVVCTHHFCVVRLAVLSYHMSHISFNMLHAGPVCAHVLYNVETRWHCNNSMCRKEEWSYGRLGL